MMWTQCVFRSMNLTAYHSLWSKSISVLGRFFYEDPTVISYTQEIWRYRNRNETDDIFYHTWYTEFSFVRKEMNHDG